MKYPGELNALINKAKRELVDAGNSADEAERMALHQARVAGWYETLDGWKRIASDLRSKINIRKAHRQPDGRYLIQDVDVFYPNAVKGKPIHDEDGNVVGHETITYNADDVRKIIDNTQLGVEDGNPVPLTPTHVRPEHKYTGIVIPAIGKGINFRESPRGDGWARCDLADVEEKTVDDWRRGRITGFSAGINRDAADLNLRFGHIAALGGEPQALSRLPRTELYAAEQIVSCGEQVCFSADDGAITGAPTMPKFNMAAIKPHKDKLFAAYAAMEAGEPGAEDKLREAHSEYSGAMKDCYSDVPPAMEQRADLMTQEEPQKIENSDQLASVGYSGLDGLVTNFSSDPEASFTGLINIVKRSGSAMNQMAQKVNQLTTENTTLRRKNDRAEFKAYADGLIKAGHNFSAEDAMKSYDSVANFPAMINSLRTALAGTMKRAPGLSTMDALFGAEVDDDGSGPVKVRAGKNPKPSTAAEPDMDGIKSRARKLRNTYDGSNFSASDFEAATAIGEMATMMQVGAMQNGRIIDPN